MRPRECQFPSADPQPDLEPIFAGDPSCEAWRQLAATFLKLQRRLEAVVAPHDLVLSQFEALAKVGLWPGLIQQELAQALLLTKGNIGALVDRLEAEGLIERRPHPYDKRVNRLYLTAKGKGLVGPLMVRVKTTICEMMVPLNAEQQSQLRALLQLIEPPA